MGRLVYGAIFAVCVSVFVVGTERASAGECGVVVPGCKVLVGYRYEWRNVAVRAGLFGCKVRCVSVCCKVPVYCDLDGGGSHHPISGDAVDINNESGAMTRSGQTP
ncbi:MAG: hypothetical protein EA381_16560 [Planctomycetaceae bacterium]|nr:MAG: hypothetical protein EA381_16560 [Planctomycetaceae bacterium]